MQALICWDLDRASQYHLHEWEDGVTLFLEGENSIALINPFAADLLSKFKQGPQSFEALLELVRLDYPQEPPANLSQALEHALEGLSQRGILIRTRS
jgi:hypothetical protein